MSNMFECVLSGGSGAITLTVTCDSVYAGTTITATDGETTLTATCPSSSPYTVEFKIPNSGSWTISGTYAGNTQTITVIIPDSATLTSPIPTGATVTPINDVQIWMHCANVWNKNYTTISQVLADTSLVTTLIASNNAADYMARSTSWASSVAANSSAMTKIGANDYCANKLLNNSTWLNAICNSTYFESVLNVKVPTMTSNTTPSGVASANSEFSGTEAYKAFDGNANTMWTVQGTGYNYANLTLDYAFPNPIKVSKANISLGSYISALSYSIQGSNDGTNFTTLISKNDTSQEQMLVLPNSTKYKHYRMNIASQSLSSSIGNYYHGGRIIEIQFYGRA